MDKFPAQDIEQGLPRPIGGGPDGGASPTAWPKQPSPPGATGDDPQGLQVILDQDFGDLDGV